MLTHSRNPRAFTVFMILDSGLGGALFGYDLGIIAGALGFMYRDIPMTSTQLYIMPGALMFGGAFATLVTGPSCDWWGRRKMIIAGAIIFIIGVILIATATHYPALLAGRLIQGMGAGIVTIAVPLYLAEAVPPGVRGGAISTFQLLLTAGILLSSLVGLYFTKSGNWRAMFWTAAIPGVLLFFGSCFLPESPRWLCLKGRFDEALAALLKSHSAGVASHELAQIQAAIRCQPADRRVRKADLCLYGRNNFM